LDAQPAVASGPLPGELSQPDVARYRFAISDREPDCDLIEQGWLDLAKPVRVKALL
jgi:hypothetical protein